MRKPLVVVCAAASALLLAGGVAATSAGADETPDGPGFAGFTLPMWPSLPFTTDEEDPADEPAGHRAAAPDTGDDQVFTDPFPDHATPSSPRTTTTTDDDRDPAPRPSTGEPGEPGDPGDRATAGDETPRRPVRVQRQQPDAGAADRPGADRAARPDAGQRLGFAAPAGGGTGLAAARRAVTAADISTSPSSPLQQRVLALVNENRRRGGCDALQLDRRLIEAAHVHAADMARRRYFAHESPNGDDAGERVSEAGYRWKRYSENIARGADSAWEVVDGWMHSPVHRENILDCRLHEMGVGLAIASDRTPYWVQDFATPDS